jgi:hydroxymethylpyrimidine pyrophosphatase-like HAD family hydrolase
MVFIDLDDTFFQTKRKNSNAVIPATESPNPLTVSYMSDEQKALWDLLNASESCSIVPVTARDHAQYNRTFISRDNRIKYASVNFGADILCDKGSDQVWKSHIDAHLKASSVPVSELDVLVREKISNEVFNVYNVDNYYVSIKNKNKDDYFASNSECFRILSGLIPDDFNLYQNDNNISIVPKCIDKKNAVQYLIEKNRPKLTIGIGDSLSDWNFMDVCHFKILPQKSQINKSINQLKF